ncbi:phytanoyl-CoA dioxygenase [Diplogelasinospora grovesii]|uniref:Phytanoyl-CoA dioxygenase n=1 Tax=Diplogelasinospora grovesii TaxID=303347 RepID=A0AAN6NH00_9PEZI|nr:phytanoyl-CoA dioxygenase [Diplogelasinospora grovesii]
MSKSNLAQSLEADGYVVVKSVLTPDEVQRLRRAAGQLTDIARANGWPFIRTWGKQFPPWPSTPPPPEEGGIWGVQHLLHPDLPIPQEDRDAFVRLYFSPGILDIAKQIIGSSIGGEVSDGDLVMELCNMLVRPDKDFQLRWHRDDVPWDATPEAELSRLQQAIYHTQWNLPLFSDDSLVVVRGSHKRACTEQERSATPYEPTVSDDQITVHLEPGDIAFYNNNILHRGVYSSTKERMTLHGSVGHSKGSNDRARNVLQHGVGSWVDRCDFSNLAEESRNCAEGMRQRLVQLGRENVDVGYSLSG